MARRDVLWLDADSTTQLPSYSALELRGPMNCFQNGVIGAGDFKITAGSGLTVDSAAGRAVVTPTAGSVVFPGLYYVADDAAQNSSAFERTGGGTGIPANSSTNPRLDAVVLHVYDHALDGSGRREWVREYTPGSASAGATLGGTLPSLPSNSLVIAEVLVPANNPATIPGGNVRDRRPWAKGAYFRRLRTSADYTTTSTANANIDSTNLNPRIELSGVPCRVTLRAATFSSAGAVWFYLLDNGSVIDSFTDGMKRINTTSELTGIAWDWVPAAGSHLVTPQWVVASGTATAKASSTSPLELVVEEIPRQNTDNS